jgi:hypothetical protein
VCTREIDGAAVEFGTSGYTKDHVFVLYDRATESVWYPMSDGTLDAVAGADHGRSIPFVAKPDPMPLGDWLAEHPDSEVLLPSEEDVAELEAMRTRPYLGVQFEKADGAIGIAAVVEGGPADTAGLKDGDRIIRIGGQPVDGRDAYRDAIRDNVAGDTVEFVVERAGRESAIPVTFGSRADH